MQHYQAPRTVILVETDVQFCNDLPIRTLLNLQILPCRTEAKQAAIAPSASRTWRANQRLLDKLRPKSAPSFWRFYTSPRRECWHLRCRGSFNLFSFPRAFLLSFITASVFVNVAIRFSRTLSFWKSLLGDDSAHFLLFVAMCIFCFLVVHVLLFVMVCMFFCFFQCVIFQFFHACVFLIFSKKPRKTGLFEHQLISP